MSRPAEHSTAAAATVEGANSKKLITAQQKQLCEMNTFLKTKTCRLEYQKVTTGGAKDEIGGVGETVSGGVGRRGGRELGDEIAEIIVGCDGAKSPFEIGHDPKLHSLDGFGSKHEFGFKQLQVQ